jgi:hypothetical protein
MASPWWVHLAGACRLARHFQAMAVTSRIIWSPLDGQNPAGYYSPRLEYLVFCRDFEEIPGKM